MSLRAATTSRHALALLLAGHRHASLLAVRGEKRCRPMTGEQECLADAVACDADAFGSRRAGRTPELLEACADGVAANSANLPI